MSRPSPFRMASTAAVVLAALCLAAPEAAAQQPSAANQVFAPSLFDDMEYRMIGPFRGGRATAEAGHPSHPNAFYVGTTGGGIWKTDDAGNTWSNISDGYFGGGIGEVIVAPSDPSVIYVGEGSVCIRGNVSKGQGVWKSVDGGKSWTHLGLADAGQVGRIAVHPRNPDVLYVAALGNPFAKNETRGVFKSTDGGDSWEKVLFLNDSTGVVDLAMNPERPNEVYAAAWSAERKPWDLRTATRWSDGAGIWKTTDGGANWTHLEKGLPSGDELVGKIGITVSPADPDRVWALIEAKEPHGGVYRSDDAGASWQRVNRNRKLRQRPFYYIHIHADPQDPNTVYALNTGMYRSVDGGKTFDRIRVPHGDVHGLWINPKHPKTMVVTDDGGGQVTVNGGETWTTYYNQPTAEFYRVEVDSKWPYNVYGPQQDNSTLRVPSVRQRGQSREQEWRSVGGGESGHISIQSYGPGIVYAGSYGGLITRKNLATGQSRNIVAYPQPAVGAAPREMKYRFQWNAPIEVNPHDSTEVYHAAQVLLKTTDGGQSWTEVSEDLTYDDESKQDAAGGPITVDATGVEIYNSIFALAFSPHEQGVIWAGTDDGRVWMTRDGAAKGNWTEVTPDGLPMWSTVNTIEVSPHDPGTVYVTVYRYRMGDFTPYVYRTDDYGGSWDRIADGTRGIDPGHATRVVREDPEREGLLYAGTEYGMYVSFDDGVHWQSLQLDLPEVPITDLKVHRGDLVVATQGRSFWILDNLTPLREVTDRVAASDAHLFQPSDAYRMVRAGYGGDQAPENPPRGTTIDYYLSDQPEGAVTIEILEEDGDVIRTFSSEKEETDEGGWFAPSMRQSVPAESGHHRVTWNLYYDGVDKPDDVQLWGYTGGYPAPPGTYRVRLVAGDDTAARSFQVKVSPNWDDVTPGDLVEQADFARTVRDTLNSLYERLVEVRDAREQVKGVRKRLKKRGGHDDLVAAADSLVASLDGLESELIQPENESGQDPINYPPQLDTQIAALYGTVVGNDSRPTDGARQRWEDLLPQWTDLRSKVRSVLEDGVGDFNDRLRDAGIQPVMVPTP